MLRTAFNSGWLHTARRATEMGFPSIQGMTRTKTLPLRSHHVLRFSVLVTSVAVLPFVLPELGFHIVWDLFTI